MCEWGELECKIAARVSARIDTSGECGELEMLGCAVARSETHSAEDEFHQGRVIHLLDLFARPSLASVDLRGERAGLDGSGGD